MQTFSSLETADDGAEGGDLLQYLEVAAEGLDHAAGDDHLQRKQTLEALEDEIGKLPARQREAFLLRYWEELDVAETAHVMGCSEGSVKTHCSRAVHALAKALKDRGDQP